jgi:hypothetical protein
MISKEIQEKLQINGVNRVNSLPCPSPRQKLLNSRLKDRTDVNSYEPQASIILASFNCIVPRETPGYN